MPEPQPPIEDDVRWRHLMQTGFSCTTCGQTHRGLFDLAIDSPAQWEGTLDPEPNAASIDRVNVLSNDFCIIEGRDFFVRCVLLLPIRGSDENFGYGVWSSLSATNFALYRDTFNEDQGHLGPWFGWFSTRLKGYPDTLGLECQVQPQNGQRPLIALEPTEHPLSVEQQKGITLDRLLEIYATNGHDLVER
jgi:hypothetical protein